MGIAARFGHWSARHRGKAIALWLLFVIVAGMIGGAVGKSKLTLTESASGDSAAALRALDRADFERPASEQVLVQPRGAGSVLDTPGRSAITEVVRAVSSTGRVYNVRSPLTPGHASQVTHDRHSAVVLFSMRGKAETANKRVVPLVAAVQRVQDAYPRLRVEEFGSASATHALSKTIGKDFARAERLSIPLTFGILLIAFGAVLAALVPLGLGLTAVAAATGLLALTSHLLHVDSSADTMVLLIGLAVGVDYSLFYMRREREERAAGRSNRDALAIAAATSGRSVLISGLTVMVAMAAMLVTGQGTFMGMAEATVLVVAVAVLGSLTVLPATLALLGDRVEKGRIPWLGRWLARRRVSDERRGWTWFLDIVLSRPGVSAGVAAAALIVLALPAARLHTAFLSPSNELPSDLAVMQTYARIQKAFPGGPQPAQVVVTARDVTSPAVKREISRLHSAAVHSGRMFEPVTVDVSRDRTVAVVDIPIAGNGQNSASRDAVSTLRDRLIPSSVGKVARAHVSGATAYSMDFSSRLAARAPLVFVLVLGLAFVLLLWTFRSIVISATAIVLNLLSVAAAYGVLVAVFQWGWGKALLSLPGTGFITSWLPLFLFVILFGLSMDYHVFILSRIRENRDRGLETQAAIQDGIVRSAGVVTSAAIVMVFVFATFATLSQTSMKQLGVGLAVAVLIDATVVRAVLLPATMTLLGERNWYMPRWLESRKRPRVREPRPVPAQVRGA
jgi:RND superfamily putative drug exporter